VWCFPAKARPISGSDAGVSSFARYIAICRGYVILRFVAFLLELSWLHPKTAPPTAFDDGLNCDSALLPVRKIAEEPAGPWRG